MSQTIQNDWQDRQFSKALSDTRLPKRGKLQARGYRPNGKFPVVDQGQKDLAGWTDDKSLVIESGLPYIVFGDHTRTFKYVDQPFVLGADGTQLLKPAADYNARFFYYACLQLDLPSRGYNRHFTFLKEKTLPLPPKQEQEKVAAVLWRLQRAIATQDRLIATTRDLKQSAMTRLFTHGLRNELLRETEIGLMPESWRVAEIDEMATVSSGGTPSRTNPAYWNGGSVPWVKTGEVDYCVIEDTEEKITPEGMKNSAAKLLPKGTLLLAMYGQGITRGKVAILGIEATTNQACAALQLKNNAIVVNFLYYVLVAGYERLRGLAHGGQQQNLNGDLIRGFTFAMTDDLDEQHEIAAALTAIDHKLAHHQKKRAALNDLFQTLLHKLMTGEIRVADIDIDTSEITAPQGVPA